MQGQKLKIGNKMKVFGILLTGFVLRIIGFNWGGEHMLFQPDEYNVVNPIIEMTAEHTLLHGDWIYPSMCTSKVIAFLMMTLTKFYRADWIDYYYFTRICYVLFSTSIIFLSYLLIKKCVDERTALFFSFLISINPIYIKYAKQVIGDTPVMMFWLLVAVFMYEYADKKRIHELVMMSFFSACASVEKWNGMGITIFIAIGLIYYNLNDIKKLFIHGLIACNCWGVFTILMAPTIIPQWENVLVTIKNANPSIGNYMIQGHFEFFFSYVGIGAVVLSLTGVFSLLQGKIASPIPIWLFLVGTVEDWLLCDQLVERHGQFVFWGCLLLVSIGYYKMIYYGHNWKCLGLVMVTSMACACLLQSIMIDIIAVKTMTHDTRVVALEYLKEIGATPNNSTGEDYTPFSPPFSDQKMETNDLNSILSYNEEKQPRISIPDIKYVILGEYGWKNDRSSGGYIVLREDGRKIYRLESDFDVDLFLSANGCGKWYYSDLDIIREAWNSLITAFVAETIGPWIEVYDVSDFIYEQK